jgi:hypothetical protein
VLDCQGGFQTDGPRQLLIDQQPRTAAVAARPPAPGPWNPGVAPAGDDDIAVPEEARCPVPAAQSRRVVRAVKQLVRVKVWRHGRQFPERSGSGPQRAGVIIARSPGRGKAGRQQSRRICLTPGSGGAMLTESAHSVPAAERVSRRPGRAPPAGSALRRLRARRHYDVILRPRRVANARPEARERDASPESVGPCGARWVR